MTTAHAVYLTRLPVFLNTYLWKHESAHDFIFYAGCHGAWRHVVRISGNSANNKVCHKIVVKSRIWSRNLSRVICLHLVSNILISMFTFTDPVHLFWSKLGQLVVWAWQWESCGSLFLIENSALTCILAHTKSEIDAQTKSGEGEFSLLSAIIHVENGYSDGSVWLLVAALKGLAVLSGGIWTFRPLACSPLGRFAPSPVRPLHVFDTKWS